jgi:Xaa-Pro aminopeptidase
VTDERLVRALEVLGADGLISADPGAVRMLTGHSGDIETGPPVFALPAVVVAGGAGPAILVCSTDEADPTDTVIAAAGFTVEAIDRVNAARRAIAEAVERSVGAGARWVIDGASVPAGALPPLPDRRIVDALPAALTAVKTSAEQAAIAAAVAVCDAGQAAARAPASIGESELDLWQRVRGAMEARAGARLPILADLASGPRAGQMGGPPTARRIDATDTILVDLVPRVDGVWGDSCAAFVRAEPTSAQRAAHAAACAALETGKSMLRPGTRSGDIDAAVRAVLREHGWEYGHHTGHGLGLVSHEEPRIVPGSETILEAGMVVALEPGVYAGEWGLRVEQVCVVTDAAPRVLSGHDLGLEAQRR